MDLYDHSLALPRKNQEDGHVLRLEVFSPIPVKTNTNDVFFYTELNQNKERDMILT